jgi:hypothetical protein
MEYFFDQSELLPITSAGGNIFFDVPLPFKVLMAMTINCLWSKLIGTYFRIIFLNDQSFANEHTIICCCCLDDGDGGRSKTTIDG